MKKITFLFSFLFIAILLKSQTPDDAAVVSIDLPTTICAGVEDIYATIENQGSNQIDSVEVSWEFNGIFQSTVKHTSLIDTIGGMNPSSIQILLGSKTFFGGDLDTITVMVSNPNGTTDSDSSNDSLSVSSEPTFSGNYTINPALPAGNGNFTTFPSLASSLKKNGLCGPVYITVAAGTYVERFHLNNIGGTSSINTITIDGQDSSTTIITDHGATLATVILENQSYVTIKNMTIETTATSTSRGATIAFVGNAHHNIITNNDLKVSATTINTNKSNIIFSRFANLYFQGSPASYNLITSNRINGGYYGVRMHGPIQLGVYNQITNNIFDNIYYNAIIAQFQDSLEIVGNKMHVTDKGITNSRGIDLNYSNNSIIDKNYIHSDGFGIYLSNPNNTYSPINRRIGIYNNMIISDNRVGIYIEYTDSVDIWHNSISSKQPAIDFSTNATITLNSYDVRNNIFSSSEGPALRSNFSDAMFRELDHNIYFSPGNGLLTINSVNYPSLSSYKTANPALNAASLQGNPRFVDVRTDLHILGSLASDGGDNIPSINYDHDGDPRPIGTSTFVDIGADEYILPVCEPVFDISTYRPDLSSVNLQWMGTANANYQIELLNKGAAQGSGDTIFTTLDDIKIENLLASTSYEVYIRSICQAGDTSIWRGPIEFTTASTVPYFEDFETFNRGGLNNGWTSSTYTDPMWQSDTTAFSSNGIIYGGPLADHTIGTGGNFAYLSTATSSTEISNMLSTPIYVDSSANHLTFSFWYHMHAIQVGALKVYVDTNGVSNLITTISGQQQLTSTEPWLKFSSYLNGYEGKTIQIRFEGIKNSGYYSTIAVDDVSIDITPTSNLSLIELVDPINISCAGAFTPIVRVGNLGATDIDSVKIVWNIDNVDIDSMWYNTTILAGDTVNVTLGNLTFEDSTIYDLKFYIKDASVIDYTAVDDTFKLAMRTGLLGNYTINPSIPASVENFVDFSSAVNALNMFGICGPVTITASAGTYDGALYLGDVVGISSTNTITFDGVDSSSTIITHDGSLAIATWIFDGIDYLTLKNVTVENTSSIDGATILFINGDSNLISNSEFNVTQPPANNKLRNIVFSGSNNIISNNKINGGFAGIEFEGQSSTNLNSNNKIFYNEFSDITHYGMKIRYQSALEINNNFIDTIQSRTTGYGISITSSNNISIHNNNVKGGFYGIYTTSTNNPSFENNYIYSDGYGLYCNNSNQAYIVNNMVVSMEDALYLGGALTATIYHNSFSAIGTSYAAARIFVNNIIPINYDVRNNIFSAVSGFAFSTNFSSFMFAHLNSNLYYSEGVDLLEISTINYTTLSDFQLVAPTLNINSIEGEPQFDSPYNLHIIGTRVNNKGDNSVGILTDIDGDSRPITGSSTVDIGADEFNPPSCPPVIDLLAVNPSPFSIDLKWSGGLGTFEYEILSLGDTLGNGMRSTTTLDSLTVGGLNQNTSYEYYVREICGRGDTSIWWGPIGFVTTDSVVDLSLVSFQDPIVKTTSCYTNTEAVEVFLKNLGNVAMDFVKDTATVSVSVSGAVNQNLSIGLTDNSLNNGLPLEIGDSILVSVGNIDMTNIGNYHFVGIVSTELDNLSSNDSIFTQLVNAASGGIVSVSSDTICGSAMVNLNTLGSQGGIQWQRLVSGVFTDELNADSVSYEVMVDSSVVFRAVACGTEFSDTVTVVSLAVPAAPLTISDTVIVSCGDSGTVALSVSSVLPGAMFNWYNDSNSIVPAATGDTLLYGLHTAPQNNNTTYSDTLYVSVVDPVSGCESERSMVSAVIVCTVGMDETAPESKLDISIYPNPSKGIFHIVGNQVKEQVEINIYNTNGKLVYQSGNKFSNNFDEKIDISEFAKGLYFVKLQGKQSFEMRKIIIN